MKNLLIYEMQRAIHLLEKRKPKEKQHPWEVDKERAEIKHILKSIRRHSIMIEKEI